MAEARHRDPAAALDRARQVLNSSGGPQVQTTAHWVIGLALQELGRPTEAVASYRRAVAGSAAGGWADVESKAHGGMAISFLSLGDTAAGLAEVALARELATDTTRGVTEMLYALVLQRTGDLQEALAVYPRAERWLNQANDLAASALLRLNRGTLYAYQGNLALALQDLAVAEAISRQRDLPVLVAMATHNLGFALGRQGDLPGALAAYSRAEEAYAHVGRPARLVAVLDADRCEMLLLAGLVVEATAAATAAVTALESVGDVAYLTECHLLLARARLAGGSYVEANAEALRAARRFSVAGRRSWAALARYVAVQAEILAREDDRDLPPPTLLRRCRRIALELEEEGWPVESVHVRTFAGRLALAFGHPRIARSELAIAVAARHRGTADVRAQAWHATALLRVAEGNLKGAKSALSRGMAVVDTYQATLGATELRARAAGHGADLARLGLLLALQERRPVEVLRWAERWRAGALRRPPIRPPQDELVAADLAELRRVRAALRERAEGGAPGTDDAAVALRARAGALEKAVRNRTLEARDDAAATGRVDIDAIRAVLGSRWLIEFVTVGAQVYAVTVTAAQVRLHDIGPSDQLAEERRYLLFATRRLLHAPAPAQEAAASALAASAAHLDQLLLGPTGLPPDAAVTIVPTGLLHGLPWATLPRLVGREMTVVPSAAMWFGGLCRVDPMARPGRGPVVLVAGPGLPGAEDEVLRLAALYRDSSGPGRRETRVVTGAEATAGAVLSALGGAETAHLAAHGAFRADSPLFSSVLLADGPVTVYEFERLRRAPRTVVLASCDAAVSAVHQGDELLGTAAALIGLGVGAVVAPVMPIPDGATTEFMVALHQRLRAGASAAAALAGAGRSSVHPVAAAFVCIGCDDGGVT